MTRITPERLAELRRQYPQDAYSHRREHHPFGHIAYSTIDIHELIDSIESAYTELDRIHADGMPRDREELQKLLNDAYRKGNQEAHRLVREIGLSAQGGEVPELDNGANPYQRNTENPGSFGWSLNRAYREGYDCARKLSRRTQPTTNETRG